MLISVYPPGVKKATAAAAACLRRARLVGAIPVGSGQGQVASAASRFGQEGLIHIEQAHVKSTGAGRHVETPDSIGALADQGDDPIMRRFESPDPMPEGQGVVFPKTFNVPHMKAGPFCFAGRDMQRNELAVGKDILFHESPHAPRIAFAASDPMIQEYAPVAQRPPGRGKILRELLFSHMFDHSDADDFIEWPILREMPIVPYLDPTAMG